MICMYVCYALFNKYSILNIGLAYVEHDVRVAVVELSVELGRPRLHVELLYTVDTQRSSIDQFIASKRSKRPLTSQ